MSGLFLDQADEVMIPMSVPLDGLCLIWAAAEMNKDVEDEN